MQKQNDFLEVNVVVYDSQFLISTLLITFVT